MEKQVEEKSRRIEELLEGLKNERESEARLEESFRVEVAAGKKLADCYKGKLMIGESLKFYFYKKKIILMLDNILHLLK